MTWAGNGRATWQYGPARPHARAARAYALQGNQPACTDPSKASSPASHAPTPTPWPPRACASR